MKKNENHAREKKSGREKSQNFVKKWPWKRFVAREKNQKKAKIGFHGHYFFHGEKKNTGWDPLLIYTGKQGK